jgi:glycosyltransferase involved in cell wall biosynthesis
VALSLRLATRVTVCTQFMANLARTHGVTPAIVPIGIDARLFTPGNRNDGPPWRLIAVGSLNRVKDQPTLLRAFRAVTERVPGCRLDLVGEDTRDGEAARIACELGIDDLVTFHGVQPTERLVPLYQRSHLFVLSSRHEAANVAALEAVACGAVPVGTHVGYLADWQAATAAPGDAEALAAVIERTLRHYPEATAAARRFREWTLTHDADWTCAAFERVYAEAATTRLPRRQ